MASHSERGQSLIEFIWFTWILVFFFFLGMTTLAVKATDAQAPYRFGDQKRLR